MAKLWAGIDAGKAHHHCVVIDADGNRLLSQKPPNYEPALLGLIATVLKLADTATGRTPVTVHSILPVVQSKKGLTSVRECQCDFLSRRAGLIWATLAA